MAKVAVVSYVTNKVVNIIEVAVEDGVVQGWIPPENCHAVISDKANIGDSHVDGEFINLDLEVPNEPTE